ncbi:MAG: glycosyltransferase family 4 protein [Candidatus Saccharibacteria bacterium]
MKNRFNKKIAIIYSGSKYFGGIEKYLLDLFDNLKNSDIELELLSLGHWELTDRLEQSGHKVTIFSGSRINPMTILRIGSYLKANKIDLLVSQATVANAYARAISLLHGVPNLVTVHSNPAGDYSNPLARVAYGLIETLTRFPTRRYIVVSNYLRDVMIKNGVSADKITTVYNGIDFPKPAPRKHTGVIIGSAGRLHPVKGYDILIQAFAKLSNQTVILKIAGAGEELDRLQNLANSLCVGDRVDFIGFQDDIYGFLGDIDIYVQSSRSEGFGLLVAEAMSQQLPVVVTPAGSLSEIVVSGKTGLVSADFKPESLAAAIDRLIDNPKLAKRLGDDASKSVADGFTIKKWADSTAQAYEDASR